VDTNTASGNYSTVSGGRNACAYQFGQQAHSSGRFTSTGDSQRSTFVLRKTTTNATPTQLALDGTAGTAKIAIPSGKAFFITASIAGILSTGAKAAHYIRKASIKNVAGTTALIGAISTVGTDVEDDAAYDVTVTANDTDDTLDIAVTGKAAETIRWTAVVEAVEIAYGV